MTVGTGDFLHLPYTPELAAGAISYALHWLPQSYRRSGHTLYDHLRRIVAAAAVELAFRRCLSEKEIPFEVKSALPFSDAELYNVWLGGRRCEIQSFLISHRQQILQMKRSPQILLEAPALVASDQNAAEGHLNSDIYIFTFLAGLVTATEDELQQVIRTDQPYFLLHVMPDSWSRPSKWTPLGALTLKSESEQTQVIEIGGRESGGAMRVLEVELRANERIQADERFFSIAYVHSKSKPDGRIAIHSPERKETHVIGPSDWANLWVYGTDILLVGYLSREEFNRRASFIREGARVFQYDRTRTKNLAVSVCDLKPLAELFER